MLLYCSCAVFDLEEGVGWKDKEDKGNMGEGRRRVRGRESGTGEGKERVREREREEKYEEHKNNWPCRV